MYVYQRLHCEQYHYSFCIPGDQSPLEFYKKIIGRIELSCKNKKAVAQDMNEAVSARRKVVLYF